MEIIMRSISIILILFFMVLTASAQNGPKVEVVKNADGTATLTIYAPVKGANGNKIDGCLTNSDLVPVTIIGRTTTAVTIDSLKTKILVSAMINDKDGFVQWDPTDFSNTAAYKYFAEQAVGVFRQKFTLPKDFVEKASGHEVIVRFTSLAIKPASPKILFWPFLDEDKGVKTGKGKHSYLYQSIITL